MRFRKDLQFYRKDENSKQGYRYEGENFLAPVDPGCLQGIKIILTVASFVQAGLVFLMGRLDFPSLRTLFTIIPYLGLIYASGRCLWAAVHLFTWKNRMTIRQKQVSWKALQDHSMISAIAGVLIFLAVIGFLLWGNGSVAEEWRLLLLCTIQPALAWLIHVALK